MHIFPICSKTLPSLKIAKNQEFENGKKAEHFHLRRAPLPCLAGKKYNPRRGAGAGGKF